MNGQRRTFGDDIGAGKAVILVCEKGIGDSRHPFWAWLLEEGFHLWLNHPNYGMDWVFINLNSMVCAPGMPGIKVVSAVREHAVTVDEFMTIWQIFMKYEGLNPLVMPEKEPAGVKLIMQDPGGKALTADLTRSDWDKLVLYGRMPPTERIRDDDSWSTKYYQALMERKTPASLAEEHEKLLDGKPPAEQRKILDRLALEIIAEYPYKTLVELEYLEDLRKKHIDERNWLKHLDRMTDDEITFMMEQLPGKNGLNANRRLHPEIPDRIRAEFLRDF